MNEDFPTLDLPQRTTSGSFSLGNSAKLKADAINF
jgi:hypothetical protein